MQLGHALATGAGLLLQPEAGHPCYIVCKLTQPLRAQQDNVGVYRELMTQLGHALAAGAGLLLQPEAGSQLGPGQPLEEYGERLCTTLAAFGPQVALLGASQQALLQQVSCRQTKDEMLVRLA